MRLSKASCLFILPALLTLSGCDLAAIKERAKQKQIEEQQRRAERLEAQRRREDELSRLRVLRSELDSAEEQVRRSKDRAERWGAMASRATSESFSAGAQAEYDRIARSGAAGTSEQLLIAKKQFGDSSYQATVERRATEADRNARQARSDAEEARREYSEATAKRNRLKSEFKDACLRSVEPPPECDPKVYW